MGNGQPRQPVYTPEDLERANKAFRELGLPEQDIYGDFVGTPVFESRTLPEVPGEVPGIESSIIATPPAPGPDKPLPVEEERRSYQELLDSYNDLRSAYVQDLVLRGYEYVPELQGVKPTDPDFQSKLTAAADRMARQTVERELGPGLVPGFPIGGYAGEGESQMKFPTRMAGGLIPAPAPAPPADLPAIEAEPTLGTALRPQTRLGETVASGIQQTVKFKTPGEIVEARGLDPRLHVKYAERERLERKRDLGQATESDLSSYQELNAQIKDAEARGKNQFSDVSEIAQIVAFENARKKFFENESNARTFSERQGAQAVLESIQQLPKLLEGKGPPSRYQTFTPEPGAIGSFLGAQVKEGRVPILDKIQKDFLESYVATIDEANLEILPYIEQFERAEQTGLETGRAAPAGSIGLEEDEGPPDIGEVQEVAFMDPPEPISMEDAQANYQKRLRGMRPPDFYAVDFWDNPNLYLQEEGLVSFFNQSYPSGASVEQPANVLMRWVAAPFNVMSTAIYETARGRGPVGSVLSYEIPGVPKPTVSEPSLQEPTESEKIAYGMDPLYAGHPYLRAIAENRNIGNDIYDLYWYNGYKDFAIVPGAIATIADMFITPGSFGVGPVVKGTSAALKAERIAKATGIPRLSAKFAKDASGDALRAAAKSFAETSPFLDAFANSSALKLTDPAEYGALRAAEFMQGANAYKAAKEKVYQNLSDVTKTEQQIHEEAINLAREGLGVKERGNSFLDFATKKGDKWASETADTIGMQFPGARTWNEYRERIFQVMDGRLNTIKDEELTRRLLKIFEENHLDGKKLIDFDRFTAGLEGAERLDELAKRTLVDDMVSLFTAFGPGGYAKFLDPLNYRFAQKGIVDALEKSPLTRGAWRGIKHVTPTLLLSTNEIKKLMAFVKKDNVTKSLLGIQSSSKRKHGLHKSADARAVVNGGSRFNPKVGSYLVVDDLNAKLLEDIIVDLSNQGYLNTAQTENLLMGLRQDYSAVLPPEQMAQMGLTGEGFGKIISSDNLRDVFNANIERIAYQNKLGVAVSAFETATGATKRAIREPLEARHLSQSWPKRLLTRVLPASRDKKQWSKLYPPDTPLEVVNELDKLRGKISQMNVTLRRDINTLMSDKDMQKAYFTDEWLNSNKVTRDDAIVALALGPRFNRPMALRQNEYQQSILSIMTATADELSLDFLDGFKPASVSRSTISDALTPIGKEELSKIFDVDPFGVKFADIQGAQDFRYQLSSIREELRRFIDNPKNFKDPTVITQIAAPDFGNITAGFYYLQKQRQLVKETIDGISRSYLDVSKLSDEAKERFRFNSPKGGLSRDSTPLLDKWTEILDLEGVKVPSSDRANFATPAQMIGRRLQQLVMNSNPVSGLHYGKLPTIGYGRPSLGGSEQRVIDEFFDLLFPKLTSDSEIIRPLEDIRRAGPMIRDPRTGRYVPAPGEPPPLPENVVTFPGSEGLPRLEQPEPGILPEDVTRLTGARTTAAPPPLKPVSQLTYEDINAEAERFYREYLSAWTRGMSGEEAGPGFEQAQEILYQAYDSITEIAEDIIRVNNLKATNMDEQLSFLDNVIDMFVGAGPTTKRQMEDVLINQMMTQSTFVDELINDSLRGLKITKTVEAELAKATQVRQVRLALLGLFEQNPTVAYRAVRSIDSALKWYTRAAYQQILAGRPAYHAVNIATGPLLTWGTVGGRAALDNIKEIWPTMQVMTAASFKPGPTTFLRRQYGLSPNLSKVIVKDPFGREYTIGDVLDLTFSAGALRSRTSVTLSETQFADMLSDARISESYRSFIVQGLSNLFKKGGPQFVAGAAVGAPSIATGLATGASAVMGLPSFSRIGRGRLMPEASGPARFLADLTETEDNIFRLSTVIGALRRGDDPIQALGVGRRALLDYGSLTQPEKWAMTRFAMFYSFWRLNASNALGVMLSNPKRFVNIYRASQTGGRVWNALKEDQKTNMGLRTNELDFYKHSFLLSRPIIDYLEGSDKESHYQVLPGVPLLDGAVAVAQLMFAPGPAAWVDPITGLIAPLPAALAGKEPSYQWRKKYVDPRDMYVLSKTWWGNYFWDTIIGEKPRGVLAPAGQEAWQGQEWRLSEPAMKRYLMWKNQVGQFLIAPGIVTNSSLPITLLVSPADRELTGRRFSTDPVDRLLSNMGLVRDIGTMTATDQRVRMLKDAANRLRQIERSRIDPSYKEEKKKIKPK